MTTLDKPRYGCLEEMAAVVSEAIKPPERITVVEAGEKYRWIDNPGNYTGPYRSDLAPQMIEPQEILTSPDYTGMIFVGPAQSGKTEMFPNWVTHAVVADPADMMLIAPTNTLARDFYNRRLAKLYVHTPALRERMFKENVFDQTFRNGMLLTLAWPSVSELSGKPIPRLWITDYDRIDEDIGEGGAYALARERMKTFKRFGMCAAESSPGFDIENANWLPSSKHQAPPTKGILALYNLGDRRRYQWKCPHCSEAFEPEFKHLKWPEEGDDLFKADNVVMECPHCGDEITHDMKAKLNREGRWIKDGMKWEKDGRITGRPFRSDIASFWMKGVCASFESWRNIVLKWLQAQREYEDTGSEQSLKATTNTVLGEPYLPKALDAERLPEELKNRAEDWGGSAANPVVPDGVRYLIAAIDVQARSFVVHVHGVGEGNDIAILDMRKIRKANRVDPDTGERLDIDPAGFPEDWDVLIDEVIERTYPLSDNSGRRMQIKLTVCDSGGREGVTTNAYNFWRRLRDDKEQRGHAGRFQLVKGEPSKTAQRYRISHPDAQRKDRHAGARGDVPVALINSDTMKDTVFSMLGREAPNGGMVRFPVWAEDWLYKQLTAEQRTPKGWVSMSRRRNEAFDLLYYARAALIDRRIRGERPEFWNDPPGWAAEWDRNDLVIEDDSNGGLVRGKPRGKQARRALAKNLL